MKRITSIALAVLLALTCCFGSALANDSGIMPLSSPTISNQNASMKAGSEAGELKISYNVSAVNSANEVGVLTIELYRSNGTYVDTIYGSTGNGLVRTSAYKHGGTYSYTGAESGKYYYAVVTLYATIGSVSDSVSVTTATVKAP